MSLPENSPIDTGQLPDLQSDDSDLRKQNKLLKIFVFILGGLLFLCVVVVSMWFYRQTSEDKQIVTLPGETVPSPTTPLPSTEVIPANLPDEKGTVSGKLCYPSDSLPSGEIVAKNIASAELTTQNYPGSFSGAGSTYTMELSPGEYNLRYQAHASGNNPTLFSSGYHTECDGSAPCDEKSHALIPVKVVRGEATENIDLCDFYYEIEPGF